MVNLFLFSLGIDGQRSVCWQDGNIRSADSNIHYSSSFGELDK